MPAFLSQRSLDSRFRGNDRLRRATASEECHLPQSHAVRHSGPSVIPTHPSLPPTVIPTHLSFPRKRESTAPPSFPQSSSPTPLGDQESKAARPMPAFLSQRSLDSRFAEPRHRGNDGLRRATASVFTAPIRQIPARPPSPPTTIPAHPSFPPTTIPAHLSFPRKRESTAPPSFPWSSSPTPTGHQEPKAARPMPAFLSQRSRDSRFRGNDGFWGATASVIPAYPSLPPIRHPRLPTSPPSTIPAHLSFPPSTIPAHLSFPPTRHSRLPSGTVQATRQCPPTRHSRLPPFPFPIRHSRLPPFPPIRHPRPYPNRGHRRPPVIPAKAGIHCPYIIPPEPVPDPNRGPRTQGRPANAQPSHRKGP